MRGLRSVVFFIAFVAAAQQPVARPNGRLEGRVVGVNGEPVAKAEIRLRESTAPSGVAVAATNAEGKFVVEEVAPGRYTIFAERAGYVAADSPAITLNVAAGAELKGIVITLRGQGVISGTVFDRDGDPVADARITAMEYRYYQGRRQLIPVESYSAIHADDRGNYRISGLPEGRYYVGADDGRLLRESQVLQKGGRLGRQAQEINLPTLFPSAYEPADASPVDLPADGAIGGVDIRLIRLKAFTVRGKAIYAATGKPATGGSLGLIRIGEQQIVVFRGIGVSARIEPDGTFELRNVLPGTHRVGAAVGPSANGERTPFEDPDQEVIVQDSNVEGLIVYLKAAAEIDGIVSSDEGDLKTFLKNQRPVLKVAPVAGQSGNPAMRQIASDGAFHLLQEPGTYAWNLTGLPEDIYVKSASFGDADVTFHSLDDSKGRGGTLHIVLASGAAVLSGTAHDDQGSPLPSTLVVIWRKVTNFGDRTAGMRIATTDQEGACRFSGLAPGDYYVAAWESLDSGLALMSEFINRFDKDATEIHLDRGSQAMFNVHQIPRSRVDAEVAKLR